MSQSQTFEGHVLMFEDMTSYPSDNLDIALGSLCMVAGFVGIVGNFLAFGYFSGKSDLPSILYRHICCIDIAISCFQFPMIYSLFIGRQPGLFNDKTFCTSFALIYPNFPRLYVTSVLLLCTSRTIAIIYPFYRIRKKLVIATLYIMIFLMGMHNLGLYLAGFIEVYSADTAYCYVYHDITEKLTNFQSFLLTSRYVFNCIGIAALMVAAVVSFVLVARKLFPQTPTSQTREQRQIQNTAAYTIVIFTGAFLLFYTPVFTIHALYTLTAMTYKDEFLPDSGMFSNYFMFWYAWPLCEVLNVLNATADFLVYLTRMKKFRSWLLRKRQEMSNNLSVARDG